MKYLSFNIDNINAGKILFDFYEANDAFHIPVNFEFDNKGEVIPGSFAEIYLISPCRKNR